jgi:hypothetical protein
MKESVAIAKEVHAKKDFSPTRSDNSIQRLRDEPERQLGSLRSVIDNIRRDGGTPSVECIATQLSSMRTAQRAPALLALQQTHGNRYVQQVVTGIQAKLKVGQPGDKYEQEADRVADVVMRMPESGVQRQPEEEEEELAQSKPLAGEITPLVQRQVEEEEKKKEEEEEENLQTKEISSQTPEVVQDVETGINSIRGGGQPLPESTRAFFEPRFRRDFSRVRIHTGVKAADAARAVNARAFTTGQDVVFGTGQYALGTTGGQRLLAHELVHVMQQRMSGLMRISKVPDEAEESKKVKETCNLTKWFNKFEESLIFTLSRFVIARKEVPVKQVEDFKDIDDKIHPAHYNPNDKTIYFSKSGFTFIYNDRVLSKKSWTEEDYEKFVIETAIEEAFHAYQDAPRHRSKKFGEFEKSVGEKLRPRFVKLIESGIMDTYKEFKEYIPVFTKDYLPESKIKEFIGENLPGFRRDLKWQLTAREEIMNQWLHILEDHYFRARGIVSGLKKGITGKGLEEEKRHKFSLIEKQAKKFAKMRKAEVKLWLLTRELEKEKDTLKQAELKKKIIILKAEVDLKNIPELEKRKKNLEAEFMKLGYKKEDLDRSAEIAKELLELEDRLDALISLRDGIIAVFKKKGLLISK